MKINQVYSNSIDCIQGTAMLEIDGALYRVEYTDSRSQGLEVDVPAELEDLGYDYDEAEEAIKAALMADGFLSRVWGVE